MVPVRGGPERPRTARPGSIRRHSWKADPAPRRSRATVSGSCCAARCCMYANTAIVRRLGWDQAPTGCTIRQPSRSSASGAATAPRPRACSPPARAIRGSLPAPLMTAPVAMGTWRDRRGRSGPGPVRTDPCRNHPPPAGLDPASAAVPAVSAGAPGASLTLTCGAKHGGSRRVAERSSSVVSISDTQLTG